MHGQDIISQSISNENLVIDEIYGHLVKFKTRSGEIWKSWVHDSTDYYSLTTSRAIRMTN